MARADGPNGAFDSRVGAGPGGDEVTQYLIEYRRPGRRATGLAEGRADGAEPRARDRPGIHPAIGQAGLGPEEQGGPMWFESDGDEIDPAVPAAPGR